VRDVERLAGVGRNVGREHVCREHNVTQDLDLRGGRLPQQVQQVCGVSCVQAAAARGLVA
jgi:hypothetical protein